MAEVHEEPSASARDRTLRRSQAFSALLARLIALRWWLLGALAIGRAVLDGTAQISPVDYLLFEDAGRILLSGHWAEAFSNSFIQTGVLQLALHGVQSLLADATGVESKVWFSLTAQVGVTALALVVTRRVVTYVRGHCPGWLELLVGAVILIGGTSWVAFISGHPSDAVVALLWVAAAVDAREDRVGRAGLWLALAAGFKQWGVLGVPALLLAPRLNRSIRGFGAQIAGTALLYGPFFLFGDVKTFDREWTVANMSLPRLFLEENSPFPWWMRVVQGVFVLLVGTIAARATRTRPAAVWIVPLALILARLLSEPFGNYYHWIAFDLIAIVAVASLLVDESARVRVVMGAGLYAALLAIYMPIQLELTYRLIFAILLIVGGLRIGSITPGGEPVAAT